MKDMFGHEIEKGDEVLYVSNNGSLVITIGVVHEVTAKAATIDRQNTSRTYRGIKDGLETRHVYKTIDVMGTPTHTFEDVTVKPRMTHIRMSPRCLILKKADPNEV